MKVQSKLGVTIPKEFLGLRLTILHPLDLHFNGIGDEKQVVLEIEEFGGGTGAGDLVISLSKTSNLDLTYDDTIVWANNPQCTVSNSFTLGPGYYVDTVSSLFFNFLHLDVSITPYKRMRYAITYTCNSDIAVVTASLTANIHGSTSFSVAKSNGSQIERYTVNNDPV